MQAKYNKLKDDILILQDKLESVPNMKLTSEEVKKTRIEIDEVL